MTNIKIKDGKFFFKVKASDTLFFDIVLNADDAVKIMNTLKAEFMSDSSGAPEYLVNINLQNLNDFKEYYPEAYDKFRLMFLEEFNEVQRSVKLKA